MIRKLLNFIRFLLIGSVWTAVYLVLVNTLLYHVWHFNLFSVRSWQTISAYWQAGGVIKTSSDYIFLTALIITPILWIIGWRFLLKVNYLNILLYPLNTYNRYIISKYGHQSSRIMLKNIKSSQEMIEEVKNQLESIKPGKPQEVHQIRDEIQKKLDSAINKS